MYLFPVFAYVSGADIVALDEHWCLSSQTLDFEPTDASV